MMDDFRNDFEDSEEEEQSEFPIDFDAYEAQQSRADAKRERKFLGMTAGQRAFLSVMLFLIVLIFGAAILAVTGRLG